MPLSMYPQLGRLLGEAVDGNVAARAALDVLEVMLESFNKPADISDWECAFADNVCHAFMGRSVGAAVAWNDWLAARGK